MSQRVQNRGEEGMHPDFLRVKGRDYCLDDLTDFHFHLFLGSSSWITLFLQGSGRMIGPTAAEAVLEHIDLPSGSSAWVDPTNSFWLLGSSQRFYQSCCHRWLFHKVGRGKRLLACRTVVDLYPFFFVIQRHEGISSSNSKPSFSRIDSSLVTLFFRLSRIEV